MEVKNIIFSGDSFTWGEGLELEDEVFSKTIMNDCIENGGYRYPRYSELLDSSYAQYLRNKWKFPTKVAEHFGVVNVNPNRNGGDNINAIQFAIGALSEFSFMEFSHVILNLTHEYRSTLSVKMQEWFNSEYGYIPKSFIEVENIIKIWNAYITLNDYEIKSSSDKVLRFYKKLCPDTKINIQIPPNDVIDKIITKPTDDVKDKWELKLLTEYYKEYREYIKTIEDKKVKVYILNGWSHSTVTFFKNCEDLELKKFYEDRFIYLFSDKCNRTFYNLKEIIECDDVDYSLYKTYDWSKNEHPNKNAHDLIAKSIIKKIGKNII